MTDCRQIESLLPPFVDGHADARTTEVVEAHLAECGPCRNRVTMERTVRTVLRARAAELTELAPPGLRTRVVAALNERAAEGRKGTWGLRITAFAAAAAVLLVVASALELVTPKSDVLYAAQLAIDHVRCFVVELRSKEPADPQVVQKTLADSYGWSVPVPPSNADAGLTLVAARRCPFWIGEHAHLLYRSGDREVSLYVTPGGQSRDGQLHVLGHSEQLWNAGGNLYTLVADDLEPAELQKVTAYLQGETR
jgi:anti-sigma factor (TIGR02949 family)